MTIPSAPFTVAAVEFNPEMFEFERNLDGACAAIEEAASRGARLIVLPECALSGYIYRDRAQFLPYMDAVPGRATDRIAELTAAHGCYVAIGIAELDPASGLTYNTGALIGPSGYIGKYRKAGLNPSDILWFTPGNTGYPVFETELGRICMVICYDDTYWEPARVPAVKGADLIAYICASDRVLTQLGDEAAADHSTIAAVQQLAAWNGLAMVATDRNNVESNPTTGVSVFYGGSASIWQGSGERTGHLPATTPELTAANPGQILYGEIDPARYDNPQRASLARRRPELYGDLAFYRAPTDTAASRDAHAVTGIALQYEIVPGAADENIGRVDALVRRLESADGAGAGAGSGAGAGADARHGADGDGGVGASSGGRLVVLPAYSLTGAPTDATTARAYAESGLGRTVQVLSDVAVRLRAHVVGSHVEHDGDALFHTAVLLGPDGRLLGSYRQTHLDEGADWATAGDDLPVFDTAIGRIGILLSEDARFPEASGVLAVRRADLIALPSAWTGSYGGRLQESEGLFVHGYPENTMALWYAIAKTAQAYTVVANPVGGGCQGSSGVFTTNPVDAEPPVVGSTDAAEAVSFAFTTLGAPDWWMNQSRLVAGRRVDLLTPLVLPVDSPAFARWRDAPGYDQSAWTAYAP
jgi:predicted amidohydrolase